MEVILIHYRSVDSICSAKKGILIMETELPISRHIKTHRNKLSEFRLLRLMDISSDCYETVPIDGGSRFQRNVEIYQSNS